MKFTDTHKNSSSKPFPLVMFSCWKVGTLLDMNVNKKKKKKKGQAFQTSYRLPRPPPQLQVDILGDWSFGGECESAHSIYFGKILLNFIITLKVNYFLLVNKIYP